MHTYWILVRTEGGGIMRIEFNSTDPFRATQQARALYGSKLITENANCVPGT